MRIPKVSWSAKWVKQGIHATSKAWGVWNSAAGMREGAGLDRQGVREQKPSSEA